LTYPAFISEGRVAVEKERRYVFVLMVFPSLLMEKRLTDDTD
jgi:hypothetical protein